MVLLDNFEKFEGFLKMAGSRCLGNAVSLWYVGYWNGFTQSYLSACLPSMHQSMLFVHNTTVMTFLYLLLAESRWSLAVRLIFFHFHVKTINNMKQNIFYKIRTRKQLHRKVLRTQTLLFRWLNRNSHLSLPERSVTTYIPEIFLV